MNGALTIDEASKRLPISEPALRNMVHRGEIEVVRIGRRIYLTEDELRRKFSILFRTA